MKCNEAELRIIDLLESGLAKDPATDLSEHLSSCVLCSAFYAKYTADVGTMLSGRRIVSDPEFYGRLVKTLEKARSEPAQPKKPAGRYLRLVPALTTAAAAVFAGIWLGSRLPDVYNTAGDGTSTMAVSERTGMLNAFAEDVSLYDASDAILENYLSETENETQP